MALRSVQASLRQISDQILGQVSGQGLGQGLGVWHVALLLAAMIGLCCPIERVNAAITEPRPDDEIVYFDNNKVIRVYDPTPPNNLMQVDWASPGGGWSKMALGDLTGDGDMEIVAIRQVDSGGGLTIFDPVAVDSPEDQVQFQNGVPWAMLFNLKLPQVPRLVATGEFDTSRAGAEILYSYQIDDDTDHFVILHSTGVGLPGRDWVEEKSWDLEQHWSSVATGNMYVDDSLDEIAMASFSSGELGIFRIDPEVVRTFTNVNRVNRWRDVAFGQYVNNAPDGDELGAVRDADYPLPSSLVFRYNGTEIVDQASEIIDPSPTAVFFGNLLNNGREQMIMVRQVRPELGPRPRLIIRSSNSSDALTLREDQLDGDNAYKGGDAGDIDGDGRDEIVIIRDNRIRIYPDPQSSIAYNLIERFTDGENVKLGNVDGAGLASRSKLVASQSQISRELKPGVSNGGTAVIEVEDVTKSVQYPFTLSREGVSGWATVTYTQTTFPVFLNVQFNSAGIQPGMHTGRILVTASGSNIDNNPLPIDLSLTVANVVNSEPSAASFLYYPCSGQLSSRDATLSLSASSPVSYTAEIEGNPTWAAISPEAGTLPEQVRVSVDPSKHPGASGEADLLVTIDLPNQPGIISRIPINLICASNRLLMPAVSH